MRTYDPFKTFIERHARDRAKAAAAWRVIRPFREISSARAPYPLASTPAVPDGKARRIIGDVAGREVRSIVYVSVSAQQHPPWVTADGRKKIVVATLNDALEDALEEKIWLNGQCRKYCDSHRDERALAFRELFTHNEHCYASMKSLFSPGVWDGGLDKGFGDIFWLSLADATACGVFTLMKGRREGPRFRALLGLMRTTMPVGFLRDAPDTAVCVTA